jgi:uncharacterized protein YbjQ (UPF0145 family)
VGTVPSLLAKGLGANAVVAAKVDYETMANNLIMVTITGTPVLVE